MTPHPARGQSQGVECSGSAWEKLSICSSQGWSNVVCTMSQAAWIHHVIIPYPDPWNQGVLTPTTRAAHQTLGKICGQLKHLIWSGGTQGL